MKEKTWKEAGKALQKETEKEREENGEKNWLVEANIIILWVIVVSRAESVEKDDLSPKRFRLKNEVGAELFFAFLFAHFSAC